MKLSGLAFACGLAGLATASTEASVYTFPASKQTKSSDGPSTLLSLRDAKLLLAERLGLSEYYDLEGTSDQALTLLNREHGSQALFSEPESVRRLLILVEDPNSIERMQVFMYELDER